jgi:hypothetical protein
MPSSTHTSAADTFKVYEIMNLAPFERKVILRKTTQSDFKPLPGVVFEIYRMMTHWYPTVPGT